MNHCGRRSLSPIPEWAQTLGFSFTIKYCWINSKMEDCQTSQCEIHQAPPFHSLNIWGGSSHLWSNHSGTGNLALKKQCIHFRLCEARATWDSTVIGTFGSPVHYKEEKLSSTAMKHSPVPHFKQIIYSVHQEKQALMRRHGDVEKRNTVF